MKSRAVTTVTNNDEYVRLRIFDGELPLEDARVELVRIECAQKINRFREQMNREIEQIVYELLSEDTPRAVYRLKWIMRRNRIDRVMRALRLTGGHGTKRANSIMKWLGFEDPEWIGHKEWRVRVVKKAPA